MERRDFLKFALGVAAASAALAATAQAAPLTPQPIEG
ncbi:twin-arginine translocation (Tat), partial [Bradyrhizobium guangdongense]